MPLDLLLVRHGESEGNVALEAAKRGDDTLVNDPAYRRRGAADYRLSERGTAQAQQAGNWVREWMASEGLQEFDRLYCSPYARALETAANLRIAGAEWRLEPLLRERDWGLWEGRGKADNAERFSEAAAQKERNKYLWRPECGESTPDLDQRARDVLATLAREMPSRRVLCVTHEDVMKAFRFRLEKLTIREFLEAEDDPAKEIHNCAVLHYTRRDEGGRVQPKFTRVRLIDTARPEVATWSQIDRPRFSNEDLLDELAAIPPLWPASKD